MNPILVSAIEKLVIKMAVRHGRFDPPGELVPTTEDSAAGVLAAPITCPRIELPAPGRTARFDFTSVHVIDGDDTVHGVIAAPRGEIQRLVVIIPGWMARCRPWFVSLAKSFARDGALACTIDLPNHFRRTPKGESSGRRFFTGDPELSALYLEQALSDVRSLLAGLVEVVPGRPVVTLGFSLGAWIAGQAASLDGHRAVLVSPAVELGNVLRVSPLLEEVRRSMRRQGVDVEEQASRSDVLDLARGPAPAGGCRIYRAAGDQVIPGDSVGRLAAAWACGLDEIPTGHMTVYASPQARRVIRSAVKGDFERPVQDSVDGDH